MSAALKVSDLSVSIEGTTILAGVSLSVPAGEVLAVLGPSGSGKSTLLRAVAGFVRASGAIELGGREIGGLPTHLRHVGLMFQNHALFPHLNVADNVRFVLTEAGVVGAEADQRITELLTLVDLDGFGVRRIDGLSGGEAQRVALARALAPEPALLMLDEPLGSLDRRLRDELTIELAELLRRSNTTALYVTHDQEEAAAVGDRLAVLRDGRLEAIGTPEALWSAPSSPWLARFLGHPNVSDRVVVPVRSITVADGANGSGRGVDGVVQSSRFSDGLWLTTVSLSEEHFGLRRLEFRSTTNLEGSVSLAIDGHHSFAAAV